MKWYSGNIAEAVQRSKQVGAVFFVAIFGDDAQSKALEDAIESSEIQGILSSDQYVCIRLTADSQEHLQFKQIYSNAESPCLYYISLMGAPVEIVHGEASPADVKQRCESALSKHSKVLQSQKAPPPAPVQSESVAAAAAHSSTSQAPAEASASPPVATGSRENTPTREELENDANNENFTLEQKIERARLLAAARAQLKVEQEAEEERNREKERIRAGKGMAELKRWQEEQELKQLAEERKREKHEEQLLRQRLREQIAQDRAERNKRTNSSIAYDGAEPSSSTNVQKPSVLSSNPIDYTGKARLQFRMPDGSSQNHNFDQDVTLGHVRKFLRDGEYVKFSNFDLCVAFPRRQFTNTEYDSSLKALGLLPSSALLVIPAGGRVLSAASTSGGSGLWAWLYTFVGYLLFPVTFLFGMVQSALPSSGNNQSPPPAPANRGENRLGGSGSRPTNRTTLDNRGSGTSTSAGSSEDVRKRPTENKPDGNIHRLRNQESDSDEDPGTWNGNSTQQKPR